MANPRHTLPKLLDNWAQNVDRVFSVFRGGYNSDTGGVWICADSGGTSSAAAECIKLKNSGANYSALLNDGRLARAEAKLRLMGQGAVAACDTGGQEPR